MESLISCVLYYPIYGRPFAISRSFYHGVFMMKLVKMYFHFRSVYSKTRRSRSGLVFTTGFVEIPKPVSEHTLSVTTCINSRLFAKIHHVEGNCEWEVLDITNKRVLIEYYI